MELRRALLLFAIVLGVVAVVTSVSNPPERERPKEPKAPAEPAGPASAASSAPGQGGPLAIRFDSKRRGRRALMGTGQPAVVTVSVESPGEVRLEGLGLSSSAEPLTPARFDVLASRPGRHEVVFKPAGRGEHRTIGLLRVESSR